MECEQRRTKTTHVQRERDDSNSFFVSPLERTRRNVSSHRSPCYTYRRFQSRDTRRGARTKRVKGASEQKATRLFSPRARARASITVISPSQSSVSRDISSSTHQLRTNNTRRRLSRRGKVQTSLASSLASLGRRTSGSPRSARARASTRAFRSASVPRPRWPRFPPRPRRSRRRVALARSLLRLAPELFPSEARRSAVAPRPARAAWFRSASPPRAVPPRARRPRASARLRCPASPRAG